MRIQNIDLLFYSFLWMTLLFFTVRVTDGKLGLNAPNMPRQVMKNIEQAVERGADNLNYQNSTNIVYLKTEELAAFSNG